MKLEIYNAKGVKKDTWREEMKEKITIKKKWKRKLFN